MRNVDSDEVVGLGEAISSRRTVLRGAIVGIGGAVAWAAAAPGAGAVQLLRGSSDSWNKTNGVALSNAGAGMHAGPDTAAGISTFTLNPMSVSCGVGSLGNSPGAVPMSADLPTGLATSGPFAMMMYATRIDSYKVDKVANSIVAIGTMRSITTMGGQTAEDVLHSFVAQGFDRKGRTPDEFFLHFKTPFWHAGNPMATKSNLNNAWAMFGSPVLFGEVNVS
jgi:hypothetical protein